MSTTLHIVVGLTVNDGQLGDFKEIVEEMSAKVEADDPGTLYYDWYLAADERSCTLLDGYRDSASFMAHFANVGEMMERLLGTCQVTRVDVYGNPSDEASGIVSSFGANITPYWNGTATT